MVSARTAALMTRTSKTTIQRQIKTGKLSATRNESGEWEIDPAELSRVMTIHVSEHGAPLVQDGAPTAPNHATEPDRTTDAERTAPLHHRREVELLQQQIELIQTERTREREQLQSRIDELAAACQDWQTQSNNATLLLSNEQTHNRRRWFGLFG